MKSLALPLVLLFTTLSANANAQFADYACVNERAQSSRMGGRVQDCAGALIVGFPNSYLTGTFHNSPRAEDPFALPKSSTVGDCRVEVELVSDVPVQSSWHAIWTLASTLNTACTHYTDSTFPDTGITGGWIAGGPRNGLLITMGRPGFVLGNSSRAAPTHATA